MGVFDVQMLYGRVSTQQPPQLLLIDLTEGRVLDEEREQGAAAVARAFVAEVCSFIDDDSSEAQTNAARALLEVLRDARAQGLRVNPGLPPALAEAPLPLAPAAVREAIAVEAMGLGLGLGGSG